MTKREAEFLFEHQGDMSSWRLEMLLEHGYEEEAHNEWIEFITDLLRDGEITKRQYNNWKDRFVTDYMRKVWELERQMIKREQYILDHVGEADEEYARNHEYI